MFTAPRGQRWPRPARVRTHAALTSRASSLLSLSNSLSFFTSSANACVLRPGCLPGRGAAGVSDASLVPVAGVGGGAAPFASSSPLASSAMCLQRNLSGRRVRCPVTGPPESPRRADQCVSHAQAHRAKLPTAQAVSSLRWFSLAPPSASTACRGPCLAAPIQSTVRHVACEGVGTREITGRAACRCCRCAPPPVSKVCRMSAMRRKKRLPRGTGERVVLVGGRRVTTTVPLLSAATVHHRSPPTNTVNHGRREQNP